MDIPMYPRLFDESGKINQQELRLPRGLTGRNLYPHQKFICAFMSRESIYRGILVIHETGSGKTYTAAAIAHNYAERGVLYTSCGLNVIENFLKTYHKYISDSGLSDLSSKFDMRGTGSLINDFSRDKDAFVKKHCRNLIIIDEVHNLRDTAGRYGSIKHILDSLPRAKVLLLTGTPMVNNSSELNDLRLLIEPNAPISYYNAIFSGIKVVMRGSLKVGNYTLYATEMKGLQKEIYIKTKRSPLYVNEDLVSLGVTSDGSYGVNAIETDVNLSLLPERSCKVAAVLDALVPGQLTLIYSSYVKGTGIMMLVKYLKAAGFSEYTKKEDNLTKCRRFAVVTGDTKNAMGIIEKFASPANMSGDIIEILVGSITITESINLYYLQHIHVLSPIWNDARLEQLVGRCMRKGITFSKEITVNLYLHVAVCNNYESTDVKHYERCQEKRDGISKAIEWCKENSIHVHTKEIDNNLYSENNMDRRCRTITHMGIVYDYTMCFSESNPHRKINREEARIVTDAGWSKATLPSCIRLFSMKGIYAVRFAADNIVRVCKYEECNDKRKVIRGKDIARLEKSKVIGYLEELDGNTRNANINLLKERLISILKENGRYSDSQLILDCSCVGY